MDKKGQWARAAARDRRTQERSIRKTYARLLQLLGFSVNEIVDFLNVSTQTVKTYLKETDGVGYSDLVEQIYKPDIFDLFTEKEQELLVKFREISLKSKELSKISENNHKIIFKKNIFGWFIHKFGDVNRYKEKQKEVSIEINNIEKEAKKLSKKMQDHKFCPHISKSVLTFQIERQQKWSCEHCGKQFDDLKMAEEHEKKCNCVRKN